MENKTEIIRNNRKVKTGVVTSNKMDKTIVVEITSNIKHPIYKKVVKHTKKFKAHDENNEANIGDEVEIIETRPLSREKRWRLVQIIRKAK